MTSVLRYFFLHPTLGAIGTLLSLALGLYALDQMPIQLMPDYRVDTASVETSWPGVAVDAMDEKVARHIDQALNTINGVESVSTTSSIGRTYHYITMADEAPVAETLDRIEQRIANLSELPAEMDDPVMNRFDASERIGNLIVYGPIGAEGMIELRKLVTDRLRDNGIDRFYAYGAERPRIIVELDPQKAASAGVSLTDVEAALNRHMARASSFALNLSGGRSLTVRGQRSDAFGLEEIPLGGRWNGLKLKDVADIAPQDFSQTARNIFRDGDGFFVQFRRSPEKNIVPLTRAIEKAVDDLRAELPDTVTLQLYAMQSYQILDRIQLLLENGLLGLLGVLGVLYLFVGLRAALWVAVGIVAAFSMSFMIMYLTGQSINMVSVFTMVMVVGLLVDDSIVVAEGIIANKSTAEGVRRTSSPVVIAAITTIVAFVPVLLVTDEIGSYVAAIPAFVCAALVASLIECFVLLPNHLHHDSFIIRLPDLPGRKAAGQAYDWALNRVFEPFLRLVSHNASFTLATALLVLAISALCVANGNVRFKFWLNPKSNFVFAHVTLPSQADSHMFDEVFDTLWTAADAAARQVGANTDSVIQTTFAVTGQHYSRRGTAGQPEKGSVLVELSDQNGDRIDPKTFLKAWQSQLGQVPDGVAVEIEERLQGLQGPPLSVLVQTASVGELRDAVQAIAARMQAIDGLSGIRTTLVGRSSELSYSANPIYRELGLTQFEVFTEVTQALNGYYGESALPGRETLKWQVRYRVDNTVPNTLDQVDLRQSATLSLSDMIDAEFSQGLTRIRRTDGKISASITAFNDNDVLSLSQARAALSQDVIPAIGADYDVTFDFRGHVRDQDRTAQQVILAFGLGLVLIYLILALSMNSFVAPVLIMGVLPFGVAGMIFGHLLLGYDLTLLSLVSLIGLFGVLVNDSILLVDEIKGRAATGAGWLDALCKGYSHRLRPIFLTSVTTVFGLLPLLLETSYQAQFLIPIAITISFGLATATLATIVLAPATVGLFLSDKSG